MKILKILHRIYLASEQLDSMVSFYEQLLQEKCSLRFSYPQVGLELAQVGSFLLIAGKEEALQPFRAIQLTVLVESMEEAQRVLLKEGAQILVEPKQVPTGWNMRVKHPDGIIVEYVEHKR
ncbi:VOC family protein [Thermoflavimicrobium dichotomicum]|uniref:VOC domain-containing protein n=1 Tax=Thermoflavimicrobium dichotomicum TaxID=46223 RepID=A0A1I3NNQ9_9BACL|nr:VOC family protein [Thermoflavimicrobium dichotomicum]SFJ10797.1 hypothetical protein SAMN05421852_104213 [Thermoflavimicrobium dichotomicum]